MKRKTFGRFAAAGMAAVSAISAVSIVASADLTKSSKKDEDGFTIMKGNAYKLSWEVKEIETFYTLDEKAGEIKEVSSKTTEAADQYKDSKYAEFVSGYAVKEESYYAYSDNASSTPAAVKDALSKANSDEEKKKDKLEFYVWWKAHEDSGDLHDSNDSSEVYDGVTYAYGRFKVSTDGETLSASTEDGITYNFFKKDKTTGKWSTTTENPIKDVSDLKSAAKPSIPGASTGDYYSIKTYKFTIEPSYKSISQQALSNDLGTKYIKITDNKIEKEIDKPDNTKDYVLDLTSTSTDGTGSGSSTSGDSYYIPAGYRYGSSTSYYVADNDTWYPNRSAVTAAGYSTYDNWKTSNWNSTSSRAYFDPTDGNYYSYSEAYNGYHPYAVAVTNSDYTDITESDYAVYKVGSLYYYNWSEAYSAAGGNRNNITYVRSYTSRGNYFSRTTGYFYSSYYDALTASGGNSARVVTLNGTSYVDPYSDPSYYWFMNGGSSNSNANLGGSSVKIGNRNGWNYVRNYVAAAKSGATLNVSLNGETTIPSAIMSALDGKNVTVNFTLSNGSVISFNGKDISNPKEVSVNVVYNAKEVPSKLVAKAKSVNDGVSTAQLTISSNTFGGEAGLNVKFNANREGYTAKIYRYNSTKNSLQYIDKGTINSSGRVSFDGLTQGGEYVIVVC